MNISNLQPVERRVLGAMLILSDQYMNVKATHKEIADIMGYKSTGGAITFALQSLDMKNYISISDKGKYKVLV